MMLIKNQFRYAMLIASMVILTLTGFNNASQKHLFSFSHEKITAFIKKNFCRINDSLYAMKYEVSNSLYEDFLETTKSKTENQSDSTVWKLTAGWENLTYLYNHSPYYSEYPVVGIKYSSAVAFCEWLNNLKGKEKEPTLKGVFSLPSMNEWLLMAGYNPLLISEDTARPTRFYWGTYSVYNEQAQQMSNLWIPSEYAIAKFDGKATREINSFSCNKFGLFCIHGNVCEMLEKEGCAMGGGWRNSPEASTPNKTQNYNSPNSNLGFRIVFRIKLNN